MLIYIIVICLGLSVGSFLNVVIDRLPKGQSVIKGRSYCDYCHHKLSWYDLIPLLSFIILKRKCRYCSASISWQYPIVELLTGFLFIFAFYLYSYGAISTFFFPILKYNPLPYPFNINFSHNFLQKISSLYFFKLYLYCQFLVFLCCFVIIIFTDLKYRIIPDETLLIILIFDVLFWLLNLFLGIDIKIIIVYFISALIIFCFFVFLFLITKGKGMGFGDVKYSFIMGILLGMPRLIIGLYIAFLTGAIVGVILILIRVKGLKSQIAFGPFLIFGTFIALLWGQKIAETLFSWF